MNINIYIYGNWKMNLGPPGATAYVRSLSDVLVHDVVKVSIFPPTVSLYAVYKEIESTQNYVSGKISLGAQNCDWRESGAVTGETSVDMVKEFCSEILVGHSERRSLFGESEAIINKKIASNIEKGLRSVLCIGETDFHHIESGEPNRVLQEQLSNSLRSIDLNENNCEKLIVAYEPVWAIGTGKSATSEIAEKRCGHIKAQLAIKYGEVVASKIPILYGGSVDEKNASSYLETSSINGLLVGGASLDESKFRSIIEIANDLSSSKNQKEGN